jgi:hypothetical protein
MAREGKMQFKKLPDNRGMIYVPTGGGRKKKHPCPDCFSCQLCGSERCRACRKKPAAGVKNGKIQPEGAENGCGISKGR